MSKERVTPDKVPNELMAGASAFFKGQGPKSAATPDSPAPVTAQSEPPTAQREKKEESPDVLVQPVRPGRDGRPGRRIMIRHPFEIYADQLEGLRERSDRVRRTGENGSMSKMVRDAIDQLLQDNAHGDPTS